jgi:AsmA protein
LKRILKWVGIFFVLFILIVVSLPFLINVDRFRPTLQSALTNALGRQVTLGNLRLDVLTRAVTADDLSVAEDPAFGKPAFLRAKSLHVGVEILPFLFSRKLIVTDLVLDQPEIDLVQSPTGDWNFSNLGAKSTTAQPSAPSSANTPLDLSVKLIKVSDGRVNMSRTLGHWKPIALEQVNIELRDFSSTSSFPFSLSAQVRGGGSLQADGNAGPLNPADSSMTPVTVNMKMSNLDLAGSGMNDVAPSVSGLVSFDGSGQSDGSTMNLKGKLQAEKLKLSRNGTSDARPVDVDFSVEHDLRKHSGVIHQGDIHIGAAAAQLTGTYAEQGESMLLNVKLNGVNMPVQELESLLPPMGVVLPAGTSLKGGTATVNLSMSGPSDHLVTTGSLSLDNTMLAGFDLPKKMGTIERLAGIKEGPDTRIQALSADLRSDANGIDAQAMKLVMPAIGELSGAGTVSPANELNFKMSATVHTSGLLAVAGNTPIPFTVGGTCSDPVFRADIGALGKQEIKGVEGDARKAAGGLLNGLLGGKKKN